MPALALAAQMLDPCVIERGQRLRHVGIISNHDYAGGGAVAPDCATTFGPDIGGSGQIAPPFRFPIP